MHCHTIYTLEEVSLVSGDTKLLALWAKSLTLETIAAEFSKTPTSIAGKLVRLGLFEDRDAVNVENLKRGGGSAANMEHDFLYTIYLVRNPDTNVPIYIGQTQNFQSRQKRHFRRFSKEFGGKAPIIEVIETVTSYSKAREAEKKQIAEFSDKGFVLLNELDREFCRKANHLIPSGQSKKPHSLVKISINDTGTSMGFRGAAEIAKRTPGSVLTRSSDGSFVVLSNKGGVIEPVNQGMDDAVIVDVISNDLPTSVAKPASQSEHLQNPADQLIAVVYREDIGIAALLERLGATPDVAGQLVHQHNDALHDAVVGAMRECFSNFRNGSRDFQILLRRLGSDVDTATLEVIGRDLGISRERVRQLEERARRKAATAKNRVAVESALLSKLASFTR